MLANVRSFAAIYRRLEVEQSKPLDAHERRPEAVAHLALPDYREILPPFVPDLPRTRLAQNLPRTRYRPRFACLDRDEFAAFDLIESFPATRYQISFERT
jgi:hypothetical protein